MFSLILACLLGSLVFFFLGISVIFSVFGVFFGFLDLVVFFKLICWRNFLMFFWLINKEKSFEEFLKNKNYLLVFLK